MTDAIPNVAAETPTDNEAPHRPRPWLAVLFTLATPGVGHLYAGATQRALVVFGAVLVAPVALLWVAVAAAPNRLTATLVWAGALGFLVLAAVDAWRSAWRSRSGTERRWYNRWYVCIALILVISLAVLEPARGAIRTQLTQAFHIPSGAMEPTLLVGDVLYADMRASARQPTRGDVVIFESVEEPGLLVVKRVAGLPGDTLVMHADVLTRNGMTVSEAYAKTSPPLGAPGADMLEGMRRWQQEYVPAAMREQYSPTVSDWGPLVVPSGHYFLMGDNRSQSYDSRFYGFVPATRLRGKPHLIYWSYDPSTGEPLAWLTNVRWQRIGMGIEGAAAASTE